jgi:hypothetical protein
VRRFNLRSRLLSKGQLDAEQIKDMTHFDSSHHWENLKRNDRKKHRSTIPTNNQQLHSINAKL